MSTTLWVVAWSLGTLVTTRFMFRFFIEDNCCSGYARDWEDVVGFLFCAVVMSVSFWPLIWLFMAARATIGRGDPATFARRVGGESRAARIARLECEARDRDRRIAEMERELLDRSDRELRSAARRASYF
jgi:hypothetical protein